MFRWYEDSQVCYAFLADVRDGDDVEKGYSMFSRSRWHRRGWTLQELLAPNIVIFFSQGWQNLGTREWLASRLSNITGIDVAALRFYKSFGSYSIAQRMSWASRRETKRLEDTAYSLMGLFDINMPLLYGEGARTFDRLQGEIMKISEDQTIFAWRTIDTTDVADYRLGLLAPSPTEFLYSGTIVRTTKAANSDRWYFPTTNSNIITNRGIQVEFPTADDGQWAILYRITGLPTQSRNVRFVFR